MNTSEMSTEARLDVIVDMLLFLVRHSATPNLADALIADLHRATAHDPERRRVVDELAQRLRERDTLVAEDDA